MSLGTLTKVIAMARAVDQIEMTAFEQVRTTEQSAETDIDKCWSP